MDKYDLFIKLLGQQCIPEREKKLQKAHEKILDGRSTYIWPAGGMGQLFYKRFIQSGYTNVKLVDSNPDNENAITSNDIIDPQNSVVIIATLNHSNTITATSTTMGFTDILMYYEAVNLLPQESRNFPDDFYIEIFKQLKQHLLGNKNRYMEMYNSLEDSLSKERFLDNMLFRLTGDITYTFEWDEDYMQYFNSLVPKFDENSVIVDAGGFTGDSLSAFLKAGHKFKSWYMFEPDEELMKHAMTVSNDKGVHYIKKGLSDREGIATFMSDGGMGGLISENGNITISLTTIDTEISEKVTFIKMDIEGAELDALKGAEKIIRQHKPTLAICLYHKANDYTDIFEFIRKCNPEYKFYIRHHLDYYAETVLYAV